MALVTLEEAKTYLRVDSSDEDALVGILLSSAGNLCADVARLSEEQWKAVDGNETEDTALYTKEELSQIREVMKDRKSTRLNSSHSTSSRMPSSA